ncbi:MAG: hypothetical protein F6K56_38710 [Moorea sp. SIO3G5]|nr:hypothetical protein [Moorena sp. SIO3G5]
MAVLIHYKIDRRSRYAMKRFGKADATRTQSVAYGLSFRAYAIDRRSRYAIGD